METATGPLNVFKQTCSNRGYVYESCKDCIVEFFDDGQRVKVDINHPSYPRKRKSRFSAKVNTFKDRDCCNSKLHLHVNS